MKCKLIIRYYFDLNCSIWVNVVPPDGIPRRLAGRSGESLLEVLSRGEVPGLFPDCEGGDQEYTFASHQVPFDYYSAGVSCGQCSVQIADPQFEKLNKKPSTEEKILERAASVYDANTRLACCV